MHLYVLHLKNAFFLIFLFQSTLNSLNISIISILSNYAFNFSFFSSLIVHLVPVPVDCSEYCWRDGGDIRGAALGDAALPPPRRNIHLPQEVLHEVRVLVAYHVSIVAAGHGLLRKFWPVVIISCVLYRPAYFMRTTQLILLS